MASMAFVSSPSGKNTLSDVVPNAGASGLRSLRRFLVLPCSDPLGSRRTDEQVNIEIVESKVEPLRQKWRNAINDAKIVERGPETPAGISRPRRNGSMM